MMKRRERGVEVNNALLLVNGDQECWVVNSFDVLIHLNELIVKMNLILW